MLAPKIDGAGNNVDFSLWFASAKINAVICCMSGGREGMVIESHSEGRRSTQVVKNNRSTDM